MFILSHISKCDGLRSPLTWLVLLELREWPCSVELLTALADVCVDRLAGCVCALPPFIFAGTVPRYAFIDICESDSAFIGSDDSEMPESVTIDDSNDDGSISIASLCFFFGNEPKPDDDVSDVSSRGPAIVLTVFARLAGAIVVDGKLDGVFWSITPTISLLRSVLLLTLDGALQKIEEYVFVRERSAKLSNDWHGNGTHTVWIQNHHEAYAS